MNLYFIYIEIIDSTFLKTFGRKIIFFFLLELNLKDVDMNLDRLTFRTVRQFERYL